MNSNFLFTLSVRAEYNGCGRRKNYGRDRSRPAVTPRSNSNGGESSRLNSGR